MTLWIAQHPYLGRSRALAQPIARMRSAIMVRISALFAALAAAAMSPAAVAPAHADGIEIVNLASGLRVDVMWASTTPFQGVFLWPDNASASQEFFLVANTGTQYFHIVARHSGQCLLLDWREGHFRNGTRVIQFPAASCGGATEYLPAQWSVAYVLDNCNPAWQNCNLPQRQIIMNRFTNKCLDAGNSLGGAPGQGAVLQQWDCISSIHQWNAGNQLWTIAVATSGR